MNHFHSRCIGMMAGRLLLAGWAAYGFGGCSTRVSEPRVHSEGQPLPPGVDAQKAAMTLNQIEPRVSRPLHSTDLAMLSERSKAQIEKAMGLLSEQRYTEAAIQLERALRYDPEHPEIHQVLANLHLQAGNWERAKSHATLAIERQPDLAAAHYVLGRYHEQHQDLAAAVKSYRTALTCGDFGNDLEQALLCHYHLAQLLARDGYLQAALSQYEAFDRRAAEMRSASPQPSGSLELRALLASGPAAAAAGRSQVFEKLGRYGDAADSLAALLQDGSDSGGASLRYARLLMQAGRLSDAMTAIRGITSNDPEVIDLLFEIHHRAGSTQQAVDELRRRYGDDPNRALLVLNLARALCEVGRTAEAMGELRGFLARSPQDREVRDQLIALLLRESQWIEALRTCAEGIAESPGGSANCRSMMDIIAADAGATAMILGTPPNATDGAAIVYLKGQLAFRAGHVQQAEALLRQSLEMDSKLAPATVALVNLLLETLRYDEALALGRQSLEEATANGDLEEVVAKIYDRLDMFDDARLHYQAALRLDRGSAGVMLALGKLFHRANERLQAQRQLRALLDQQPDHEEARELLANLYWEERKFDVAAQEFAELRRRSSRPTTDARCTLMLDPDLQKNPEAARELLLKSMEEGTPDARTWLGVANTYGEYEPEKQKESLIRAYALDPADDDVGFAIAEREVTLLEWEKAVQRVESLLLRRPNRHAWRLFLVNLYVLVGDLDKAEEVARAQGQRDNLSEAFRSEFRDQLLIALRAGKKSDQILEVLRNWVEADPDNQRLRVRLAREYVLNEQAAAAVEIFEQMHKADPRDNEIRERLISALSLADQHERALQYAVEWLSYDPDHDENMSRLARVLLAAKRYDEGLELARNRLLRTQNRSWYQDYVIMALVQAQRFDEAIEWIRTLLDTIVALDHAPPTKADPDWRDYLRDDEVLYYPDTPFSTETLRQRYSLLRMGSRFPDLIDVMIVARKYRDAERELADWLGSSNDPQRRFQYLRALATCQHLMGKDEEAWTTMERALVLNPLDLGLNNDLAYGWIDRGVRLSEAEPMIRLSLGRAPRTAAYLDTYGWLHYKKGDFAEARKWLLRAIAARGEEDPVILDHLGDTCWRLGRKDEAIEHWTQAVRLIKDRTFEELADNDRQRVKRATATKIEDAQMDRSPGIAPLGGSDERPGEPDHGT